MNKKKFILYSFILLCLSLGSCKKFLAEVSQDEIRPTTTTDLASLMYSDAYPYNEAFDSFDILTDDIVCNGVSKNTYDNSAVASYVTALQNGMAMFTFNPMMFESTSTVPPTAIVYDSYYKRIKGCNVVIDNLDKVSGTQQDKNAILGQCLFLRSYYYLKLVMTYGQPYSGTGINPESNLGVPLVLSSQVKDGGLARSTLKQVYDQIEKDLLTATDLLNANYIPTSTFRVGNTSAWALLSRFYLYRGLSTDWDKVIDYANRVLAVRSTLTQLNTFYSSGNFANQGIYQPTGTEVLWVYGGNTSREISPYFPDLQSTFPPYAVSNSLSTLYDRGTGLGTSNEGDLRYQSYFSNYINGSAFLYRTSKSVPNGNSGARGFRVAEVYLNRAEAYIKRLQSTGNAADRTRALADLNTLRASRYDTRNTAYTPVVVTDAAALFKFYQDERRRELCLEDGHRWEDIKRWGLSVQHTYIAENGTSATYTLQAGSLLYALPIPYQSFQNNPSLVQNPR